MLGGKNRQPLGYTIIEVMIVLAVSGVMFAIAATFINGKQEKTSFTQGVGQLASSIQDTIEQVTDGRYSDIPFTCTPGYPQSFSTLITQKEQGTDSACIFMGKFFHFDEAESTHVGTWDSSDDPAHYEVFTLAGDRLRYGLPVVDRANAHAMAVQGFITGLPTGVLEDGPDPSFDLTDQEITPQNLQVTSVSVVDDDTDFTNHVNPNFNQPVSTWGFGFVQSGNYSTTTSGSQNLQLVYVYNLKGGIPHATEYDAIGDQITQTQPLAQYYNPHHDSFFTAKSATICVTDGTQYAHINVGDPNNGSPLSVNVDRQVTAATC